jgi:dihydropteroate synthase
MRCRGKELRFEEGPKVMGILNLGADSFSGDGIPDVERALERARKMIEEGADLIDLGAESARTNRGPVSEAEETEMLLAFVRRWSESVPLSINTWRPAVVAAVLAEGGDLLNDIGALPDDRNARICAETGAALLIMHSIGQPKVAHTHVGYPDVWAALETFFEEKIQMALNAGMSRDSIVLDPGIDFAKQKQDNLRIYRELERLHRFQLPILLPVSRKTVVGEVLGISNPADRDAGTVACVVQGILKGAAMFRVHNVRAAVQTVRTVWPLLRLEAGG